MKKFSASLVSALLVALLVATTVLAAFTNGDFEAGTFTGWVKATFLNGLYPTRNPGGSDLTAVLGPFATQSQSDPHTNGNLLYPPYGQYVARVNSDLSYAGGGYPRNGNTLSQLALVEAGDVDPADSLVHVRFVYAGVMVNPLDHSAAEKPYIYVVVKNHTKGDDILYEFQSYAGEVGKGWVEGPVFSGVDKWQYLDWQYVDIAESVAHPVDVGDEIYVEVTAVGCEPSGHPGYAYVDEFSFLKPAPIITVTDSPDPVYSGSTLTYTFNYRAINAVDNPVIYIPIPAQTTFSSVSDANCTYDPTAPASVTCNMPSLASGASGAPFTMDVTVNAPAGGTVTLQNYTIQGDSTKVNTGSPVDTAVIAPPNTPPSILEGDNVTVTMSEDGAPVPFALTLHATDPEGDPLTWSRQTKPTYGVASVNAVSGVVTYVPFHNYYGPDSFIVDVSDGVASASITVNVIVEPVADADLGPESYHMVYNSWRRKENANSSYITSQAGRLNIPIPASATTMQLLVHKGPDQGRMQIQIDGVAIKTMEMYNSILVPDVKINLVIPPGSKTVTVIALGSKTAASTGTWVRVVSYHFNADANMVADVKLAGWPVMRRTTSLKYRATAQPGTLTLTFTGQHIGWYTYRGPNAGMVEIYMDGILLQAIDLYNATPLWDQLYEFGQFPYGLHTFEVRVLSTKNPASTSRLVVNERIDKE